MVTRRFLLLVGILFCLLPVLAWADFPPIPDDEMKFNAVPGMPGASAAVLFHEESYDDFRHAHEVHVRLKVLTEEGRKYADVEIPYERSNQLVQVSGRTVHADGKIIAFQGKPFEKTLLKGKGFKYVAKVFTLPDVQPGSILEYHYTFLYPDEVVYAPNWVVQSELWQKYVHYTFVPFASQSQEIMIDHDQLSHGVAWTSFLPNPSLLKRVHPASNKDYIDLEMTNVPAFIEEPFMPDSDQFKFNVRFYYASALNEKDYWKAEGKFWNKDVEKFLDRKNGLQDTVNKIVGASDSPEQKARKIYAFVIGLDNNDYLPERTALEQKALGLKDVKGAEDVLKQKRGDADEMTRLFAAMARAAGIPAYLMRVTSRERNFFIPSYLDFRQLDAEIAILQIDGKEVFLDPGAKYCKFGLLDWRHTAAKGLRQTSNGVIISETPPPSYKDAITQRIARLTLKPDGMLEGPARLVFVGIDAVRHRQSGARLDDEGRKKELEDEVKTWLPAESEVKITKQPNWNDVEANLTVDMTISTPMLTSAGKRVLLPSQVFHTVDKAVFPHAQRINGVYLYFPSREVDQVTLILPPQFVVESLPQKEVVQLEYAMYSNQAKQEADKIELSRDLAMAEFVFPVNKYGEVKGFYDKVKTNDDQQIVLRSAANAVSGN